MNIIENMTHEKTCTFCVELYVTTTNLNGKVEVQSDLTLSRYIFSLVIREIHKQIQKHTG